MPEIQEDAPHPRSYRPDLPLRSELPTPAKARYNAGYIDGFNASVSKQEKVLDDAKDKLAMESAKVRRLESENAKLLAKVRA